jgi:hypothetical protein
MITLIGPSRLWLWKANTKPKERNQQKEQKMKTRILKITSPSALVAMAALTVAFSIAAAPVAPARAINGM